MYMYMYTVLGWQHKNTGFYMYAFHDVQQFYRNSMYKTWFVFRPEHQYAKGYV